MPHKHQSIYLSTEQSKKLQEIARSKGYICQRGAHIGEGSISLLMQALADGELTAIRLGGIQKDRG